MKIVSDNNNCARLRILMLAPTPFFSDRGCHVRILEEARALQNRGHKVAIVTYHLGKNVPSIEIHRTPNMPWYRKLSAGPSWHKPYLDILLFFTALRVARQFRPHIIHAHLHEGAFVGFFLSKLTRKPMIFDCQGSLTGELIDHGFIRNKSFLFRFFELLEKWIVQCSDVVVASSTPTAKLIKKQFNKISHKVISLPDAVDLSFFAPQLKSAKLADRLGLPENKKIIAYLGALTEYQGVGLLMEVVQNLSLRRRDFHMLIMGYPEHDYCRRAVALGISEFVTFTGKIDYSRAPEFLALADVAVSPKMSATEANGKLLNYIACGLPCVVFDSSINRELLGTNGIYAAPGDCLDFGKKLEMLLDASDLSKRSETIREDAVLRHGWDERIKILEEVYVKLQSKS